MAAHSQGIVNARRTPLAGHVPHMPSLLTEYGIVYYRRWASCWKGTPSGLETGSCPRSETRLWRGGLIMPVDVARISSKHHGEASLSEARAGKAYVLRRRATPMCAGVETASMTLTTCGRGSEGPRIKVYTRWRSAQRAAHWLPASGPRDRTAAGRAVRPAGHLGHGPLPGSGSQRGGLSYRHALGFADGRRRHLTPLR